MANATPRKRLACTACTRRKVRCDKATPCKNCLRRGERCVQDDIAASDLTIRYTSPSNLPHLDEPARRTEDSIEALQSRVAELQRLLSERGATAESASASRLRESETDATLHAPSRNGGNEVEDAATVLEDLAWGRPKNPDVIKVASPWAGESNKKAIGDTRFESSVDGLETHSAELAYLQSLLPGRHHVQKLVDYHHDCLLWAHGSYVALSFQHQLNEFYSRHGGVLDDDVVSLQWTGLLFAVLAGSIVCAPPNYLQSLGYRCSEQEVLSKRWFTAVMTCLNMANFTANHCLFSIQAISTLACSAHPLGYLNSQSVLLASAIRIAQSLGIHRLAEDVRNNPVDLETGRRLWSQLCSQDWFSIPFAETYLISPICSTSSPPKNCHDQDMSATLCESVPTVTSFCRIQTAIASLMPKLQDELTLSNTPYTKYEAVLKYDRELRRLESVGRPLPLMNVPVQSQWPKYIPWARQALAISSSHKIIMIHRKFLGASFTNPMFASTKRTCLAAAKTIIREYQFIVHEDAPSLWTHEAFSVVACIIICLHLIYSDTSDEEQKEHWALVEDVVRILQKAQRSMIARRGVRLLTALLDEASRILESRNSIHSSSRKRKANEPESNVHNQRKGGTFDVQAFKRAFCHGVLADLPYPCGAATRARPSSDAFDVPTVGAQQNGTSGSASTSATNFSSVEDAILPSNIDEMSMVPGYPTAGLNETDIFENLFFLANHDLNLF